MMNNRELATKIVARLEREFDLPFTVEVQDPKEFRFLIYPDNDDEGLFALSVYIRDRIRYIASLTPQKYGRAFVSTMQNSTVDMRAMFEVVVKDLLADGCRVTLHINDEFADAQNPQTWPIKWDKIEASVVKSPFNFVDVSNEEVSCLIALVVKTLSLFLSLVPIEKIEETNHVLHEGEEKYIQSKKYERNPIARSICIEKHGCKCAICGFDFSEKYGSIGNGFIEVHHITPISTMGGKHEVDPEHDLIPLCSNCHSMIHRKNPPFTPDELKKLLGKR